MVLISIQKLHIWLPLASTLFILGCNKANYPQEASIGTYKIETSSNNDLRSSLRKKGERLKLSDSGAEYVIQNEPVKGYNNNKPDNIAVIELGNGLFARLDNKQGVYPISWFGKGDDAEAANRGLSYVANVEGNGKLILDRDVTFKNTIYLPKGSEFDGCHIFQSNTGKFRPVITADLNDSKKNLFEFVQTSLTEYNPAVINNVKIKFISPANSAMKFVGPIGTYRNVYILGDFKIENGIEVAASMFCTFDNFFISGAKNCGFYFFRVPAFVGTTTQLENSAIAGNRIGIIIDKKAVVDFNVVNTTFELLEEGISIIKEGNSYVKFDRIYSENIGKQNTNQALFDTNSPLIISNSSITGSRYGSRNSQTIGIKADKALYVNCHNTWFNSLDRVIEKTASVKSVSFVNCSEGSITMKLNDQINSNTNLGGDNTNINLVNHVTLNGSSNNMFIHALRATMPTFYASDKKGITITQSSSPSTTAMIYPDYSRQDGELVIVPGGKNRAATFGTDGGVTIGKTLKGSPPTDGIRVQGQGIYGEGSPHQSAILDLNSKDKGFLPPRVTTTQRDAIIGPAEGLIIYNITTKIHQGFNGRKWNDLY